MKKILAICLAVVALLASCRPDEPDVDPVVLKGGVDMGLVLTREDGTTYKLYWAESNLCERGLCRRPEDLGDYCVDESLAGSDRPMRVLRLEIKR